MVNRSEDSKEDISLIEAKSDSAIAPVRNHMSKSLPKIQYNQERDLQPAHSLDDDGGFASLANA